MWSFTANLGNFGAATGSRAITEGYYQGVVQAGELTTTSSGRQQIAFKLSIASLGGAVRTWWVGIPRNPDDNVLAYWRSFAESCGFTAAQLGTGEVELTEATFKGKTCHFYYLPKNESTGTREKLSPLPPNVWAERKTAHTQSASAQMGSALREQVPQGMPAMPPGMTVAAPANGAGSRAPSSADVMSALTGASVPTLG